MTKATSSHLNLSDLSIRDLHRKMQFSEIDSLSLAELCIANQQINEPLQQAYHGRDEALFRREAQAADQRWRKGKQSELTGLPVSVKNIFAVDGYPCFAGTPEAMPAKWQQEGSFVKRLRTLSCPVSGVTHTSEFAFGGLGLNPHWGTPRNPWDAKNHRIPGGSSSGAALSVISNSCIFAVGTDTGGSIRVPAAAAGLVGLKTSKNVWACDGIIPLSTQFDSIGIITKSVADSIDVYCAINNVEPLQTDSKNSFANFSVRLADPSSIDSLSPDLLAQFDAAIHELSRAGMQSKQHFGSLFNDTHRLISEGPNTAAIECSAFIHTEIPHWRALLGPRTAKLLDEADKITAKDYIVRMQKLKAFHSSAGKQMKGIDIIVSPTLTATPALLSSLHSNENYDQASSSMLKNTLTANLGGFCAITIPSGIDSHGMPTGLQFMANAGDEYKLLKFALLAEGVLGTSHQRLGRPPLLRTP